MKLYWSPRSPFVRKVMVCAHEIGIADRIEKIYTLVSISNVNAEMLRVNPLGRIPALVTDEGEVLYDSVVICEYLDVRFGERHLFPVEGTSRWAALRRHALADGLLESLVLWRSLRSAGAGQPSDGMLAAFERKAESALDAAETEAAASRARSIDIGDITLGIALGYLDFRYPEMDWRRAHPGLADGFARFGARPSMQHTAPEDERTQTQT